MPSPIDVSCDKNQKEEKENTQTNYYSSLLHLQNSGFMKCKGCLKWFHVGWVGSKQRIGIVLHVCKAFIFSTEIIIFSVNVIINTLA